MDNFLLWIVLVVSGLRVASKFLSHFYKKKEDIRLFFRNSVNKINIAKINYYKGYCLFTIFIVLLCVFFITIHSFLGYIMIIVFIVTLIPQAINIIAEISILILWILYNLESIITTIFSLFIMWLEIFLLFLLSVGIPFYFMVPKDFFHNPSNLDFPFAIILMIFSFVIMLSSSFATNFIRNHYLYNEWIFRARNLLLSFVITILFATLFGLIDLIIKYFNNNLFIYFVASLFSLSIEEAYKLTVYWIVGIVLCYQMTNNVTIQPSDKIKSKLSSDID